MNKGYGLIEIIVAVSLFATIATVGIIVIVGSFTTNRLGEEHTQASLFAQEGIEAARSMKNQGWNSVFLATDCSAGCGVSSGGGSWLWSGSQNAWENLSRIITVEEVLRDGSGTIVTSGGTADPDTRRVVSTVTWDFTPTRENTVELITYFTNFVKTISSDWSTPQILGTFDLTASNSGNNTANANAVAYQSDYVYLGRLTSGGTELFAVDVSTPSTPSLCANCQRELGGSVNDIEIDGNYAYLASAANGSELQIIDISNPTNLNTASIATFDLTAGNSGSSTADAIAVAKTGNTLYMIRAGGNEFIRFNVTNPLAPSLNGTNGTLDGTPTDMVIVGSYAYVTSTSNSNELQIFDLSSLARVGTFNLDSGNGNADALSIEVISSSRIAIGRASSGAPEIYIMNLSSPTAPTLATTVELGANAVDLSYGNNLLFVLTNNTTTDLRILDATNPDSIPVTPLGTSNLANSPLDGYFASLDDRYFVVGSSDTNELEILTGQ